jgi:hypothetical protein
MQSECSECGCDAFIEGVHEGENYFECLGCGACFDEDGEAIERDD